MSGHHSVTTMLTVLLIFMVIYFIALGFSEVRKRIGIFLEKKKEKNNTANEDSNSNN